MRIVPIACLRDNYAYLVVCEQSGRAAVVDPSEAEPVLAAVRDQGVELTAIWNTHHHWDHTGGNKALLDELPGLDIVAHESDRGRVPGQTSGVGDGDHVDLGAEVRARVIHNPGHTSGAVSYVLEAHDAVFTGDTLFLAGCGRVFEGTHAEMHASLSRLAALPDATRVFCGHEYTQANLAFAAAAEPGNQDIGARQQRVEALRAGGAPTVPATIAEERATNPFLRVTEPGILETLAARDSLPERSPPAVFAELRTWKDSF